MRAHFGLPSVVGELNEGKVGLASEPFLVVLHLITFILTLSYINSGWHPPNLNVLCSLQSMSSLRSLTSPPQAFRSELFSDSTHETQLFTVLSVPQVRYLKIIEKSGYQVSLITGRINQFARRTQETSQNMFLHFSLSWPTRNWNLRRESYISVASIGSFWQ